MPVITPEVEPTVAVVVLVLLQMPPETVLLKVVVAPAQTELAPEMADGVGDIVTG